MKESRGPFTPLFLATNREVKKAAVLSLLGFGHKPRGEGRPCFFHFGFGDKPGVKEGNTRFTPPVLAGMPRSFHPSVWDTNREVKEGRAPFTLCFGHTPAAVPSPFGLNRRVQPRSFHLGVGHKPRGAGMPCSFHPFVLPTNREVKEGRAPFTLLFGYKSTGEGKPCSFHPSALATNREVNPLPVGLGHKPKRKGRPRSFHPSVLATNREVKEGRFFMPRFWLQTER